jgi:hypothetical protein
MVFEENCTKSPFSSFAARNIIAKFQKICNFARLKPSIVITKSIDFPTITTVVQAEPWEKGHVARITSFRPVTNSPKQHKKIAEL